MALLLHRETPPEAVTSDPPAPSLESPHPSRRWWLQRVVTIGLWTLVVAGVALGIVALSRPTAVPTPTSNAPADLPRWDVIGFAEVFIATFLAAGDGTESTLAPFLGETPPALTGVVAGEWFASQTVTVSVDQLDRDRWAVVAAVDLLRRDGTEMASPYVGLGTRFFRVEIVEQDGALVAVGLPAVVAGPVEGEPVDDGWPGGSPPVADDPLDDTVARFLAALLTGNGELARYAAPGSDLRAAPATFTSVTVDRLAVVEVGKGRRVRAWLTGVSGEASMQLTYDVRLARRDGRWEVTAVGTPPAADPARPAATADPSSTTNGS